MEMEVKGKNDGTSIDFVRTFCKTMRNSPACPCRAPPTATSSHLNKQTNQQRYAHIIAMSCMRNGSAGEEE